MLFVGKEYEGRGGAYDLDGHFASVEAALAYLNEWGRTLGDWAHAYDVTQRKVVADWRRQAGRWMTPEERRADDEERQDGYNRWYGEQMRAGKPFYTDKLRRWHMALVDGEWQEVPGHIPTGEA